MSLFGSGSFGLVLERKRLWSFRDLVSFQHKKNTSSIITKKTSSFFTYKTMEKHLYISQFFFYNIYWDFKTTSEHPKPVPAWFFIWSFLCCCNWTTLVHFPFFKFILTILRTTKDIRTPTFPLFFNLVYKTPQQYHFYIF